MTTDTFSRTWTPTKGDLVIPCNALTHVPLDPGKGRLGMIQVGTGKLIHVIPGPVVALGGFNFLHPDHGVLRLAKYEIVSWKTIAKEQDHGAAGL